MLFRSCTIQHATHMVTRAVSVNAYDASNNAIVSDGWYDADGNPVKVNVTADNGSNINASTPVLSFTSAPPIELYSPLPAGTTPTPLPSGVISPSPAPPLALSVALTGPTANQFYITYNPQNMTSAQFTSGFGSQTNGNTTTLTAVPSNGVTAGSAKIQLLQALLAPNPVPSTTPSGASANASYLSAAPDKTFWVTQASGGLVQFNPSTGTWSGPYALNPASTSVNQNLPLKDGSAVWVADRANHGVDKLPLPAAPSAPYFTPIPIPTPEPSSLALLGTALLGTTGLIWRRRRR